MIERAEVQRRFCAEPALSLVPEAREPWGLLSDDGTRRFVVDVEIARSKTQSARDACTAARSSAMTAPRQGIFRTRIDDVENVVESFVGIDVNGGIGPKYSVLKAS